MRSVSGVTVVIGIATRPRDISRNPLVETGSYISNKIRVGKGINLTIARDLEKREAAKKRP